MKQTYLYPDSLIVVFAKSPEPGQVKTRLASSIGAVAAAEHYAGWVEQQVRSLSQARIAPLELWVSPDIKHPCYTQLSSQHGMRLRQQPEGGLGERMSSAFSRCLRGHKSVVLIGTDAPVMTVEYIRRAFTVLDTGIDVVLGPADDGGYVMVGQAHQHDCLFDHVPWSTPGVMKFTRRNLVRERIPWAELETLWDIDTVEEFERWQALDDMQREVITQ